MTQLRFNITMSLDGYVAGPNQSLENPLGEGGEELHNWAFPTRYFHEMQGQEGGETGADQDILVETFNNLGATIMGRNMFGGGTGAWDESWRGWWGENPPYHTDVFVLTHHPREALPMQGGTTFHFVTDGIQSALEQAKKAAASKDISLAGGAQIAQQFLKAGLIDAMELHVVPHLLGSGSRLFDNTDGFHTNYECVRIIHTPAATHYKYRRRS